MFSSELELQKYFHIHLCDKSTKNEKIIDEFNARFGNVDIVKVTNNNSVLFTKEQASLLSQFICARLVSLLHKKSIRTLEYIKNSSGYDYNNVKYSLKKMISAKIVSEVSPNRFLINDNFSFPYIEFTSYEAKLHDWKKAITQANNNKNFSTYSYVVFPDDMAKKLYLNKSDYFKYNNIGLIGVTKDNFKIYLDIKKNFIPLERNPTLISSMAKFTLLDIKNEKKLTI